MAASGTSTAATLETRTQVTTQSAPMPEPPREAANSEMPVKLAAPSASRMPRRSRGGATGPPAPISTNVPAAETAIATNDSGCSDSPPIAA